MVKIYNIFFQSLNFRAVSPPHDVEAGPSQEVDSDWADDLAMEEEDSGGEDSDDESLNSKLCTFTMTQKEFMNQHWWVEC